MYKLTRKRVISMICILIIVTVLTGGIAIYLGTSNFTDPLSQQEHRWRTQHIRNYRYRFTYLAMRAGLDRTVPSDAVIEVRQGIPIAIYDTSTGQAIPEAYDFLVTYAPIEQLFTIIRQAHDRHPDVVNVVYAPTYGYPQMITIEPRTGAFDDRGETFRVTDFTIIPE